MLHNRKRPRCRFTQNKFFVFRDRKQKNSAWAWESHHKDFYSPGVYLITWNKTSQACEINEVQYRDLSSGVQMDPTERQPHTVKSSRFIVS
jgi:hypothetical protein